MKLDLSTDPFGPEPTTPSGVRSLLTEDLVLVGDLHSGQTIEIAGTVRGTVVAAGVTIAKTGRVEGHIAARTLAVFGHIEGTVAAKVLVLHGSAVVYADVLHERITIEDGAIAEGRLERQKPKAIAAPEPVAQQALLQTSGPAVV